ncbi:hypothetical protein OIV83_004921 [Microbotryomycetes sp. JL201]|nr:hypothetical protein OIV83_004921 [Microbotryomycetes sp. JL201]
MPSADANTWSNHAQLQLPVIDISSFLDARGSSLSQPDPSSEQKRIAQQVHAACTHQGFFYVTGFESVASDKEMQDILSVTREFFARPVDEKKLVAIRPGDGARGWQQLGKNVTQGYDRPVDVEDPSKLLHGPNPWPAQPAQFRPKLETWIDKMSTLGKALMRCTAMGLGIYLDSDEWQHLESSVDKSFWVMRCIGYPPLPDNSGKGISCGAHRDYGCYTLLHQDDTQGALQVFLRSEHGNAVEEGIRGTWINADRKQGCFVVNIGEMWKVWSNGLYEATLHRVIHRGSQYRISIPFFYEPNWDAVVEPLPSALKQTGGKPVQKSVVYGEFLSKKVSGNFL